MRRRLNRTRVARAPGPQSDHVRLVRRTLMSGSTIHEVASGESRVRPQPYAAAVAIGRTQRRRGHHSQLKRGWFRVGHGRRTRFSTHRDCPVHVLYGREVVPRLCEPCIRTGGVVVAPTCEPQAAQWRVCACGRRLRRVGPPRRHLVLERGRVTLSIVTKRYVQSPRGHWAHHDADHREYLQRQALQSVDVAVFLLNQRHAVDANACEGMRDESESVCDCM